MAHVDNEHCATNGTLWGGNGAAILSAKGIWRSFGAVQALKGVSIDINANQVTALVGDNGAGKSSLVKILCGADQPDDGQLYLEGKPIVFRDPLDARAAGIEAVYQDLSLAPELDVSKNLFLGREMGKPGLWRFIRALDQRRMRIEARAAIAGLNINIPAVETPVRFLSGGQRQAVAVARAVMWAERVVIMDEPTAALGVAGTKTVLDIIHKVRDNGAAVLVISHSLPEVFAVADRIVVLRHGQQVADLPTAGTNMEEVVGFMTGALSR